MARTIALLLFLAAAQAQVSIYTGHVDNSRTGANLSETTLTPANVVTPGFSKKGTMAVDGNVHAQPLYLYQVTVSGGTHNLLIVATEKGSMYGFDADTRAQLWKTTLGEALTSYPSIVVGDLLYGVTVGCPETPVVDPATNILYAVCANAGKWVLYKLQISDGTVLSSTTIFGRYTANGDRYLNATAIDAGWEYHLDSAFGGKIDFMAIYQLPRAPLTVANGNVYVTFGSYSDVHPWHGWAFAYRLTDLTQIAVYCVSGTTFGGGLWGASGGLSVDSSGNLYMMTGNGRYDGTADFGESVLKFSPALQVLDWFTPSNWATLDTNDSDLSSGRVMLIPNSTVGVGGAKDFNVYAVGTTCLGHLQGSGGCATYQVFPTNAVGVISDHSGVYGGTFYNNKAYFPNTNGKVYIFTFNTGTQQFNTTPATSTNSYEYPGAQMSASGNGASNGIIWAVTNATTALFVTATGTLRAFDASTFTELYNSDQAGGAVDALGIVAKFVVPLVVNGKVYVPTQSGTVAVYGL